MWRDRIQFADDDLGIAGMGRSLDSVDAAVKGSVRTRRDAEPKPNKCVARPVRTLAWTQEDEEPIRRVLSPAQEAKLAVMEYDAAVFRLGIKGAL